MDYRDGNGMSTHFQSTQMFQLNARLPRRLAGGLSLRLSYTNGSNQMFLSFKKCPGGDVCKGLLVSEHSINASQLLNNSVSLSLFSAQFIREFV